MNKFLKYIRGNIILILVSALTGIYFSFFLIPWIFSKSWIKPILSFENLLTDTLLAFGAILLFFSIRKPAIDFWRRYKNNFNLLEEIPFTYMEFVAIFLCIFIIWLLSNILNPVFSKGIYFLLIGLNIMLFLFCVCCKRDIDLTNKAHDLRKKNDTENDELTPDEPITHESEDLLGREKFVEDLYNQIINYPPLSDSFVFGLYGTWGEGKTTVLNLLKNRLDKNDNIIVYKFDPWYFSSQEDLIKGFYEGLYSALNKKYFLPNTKKIFNKYKRLLSSGLKLTGINVDIAGFGAEYESLEEIKTKIGNWILSTRNKVTIIIDDVDRLQSKEEILSVFKIIKLSANFKNTIFVVSFDPNIVSCYLKDEANKDPSFLDKIIQCPIHLPPAEQTKILDWLKSSYDKLFNKISKDKRNEIPSVFFELYKRIIYKPFYTFRDVKRYINSLVITLPNNPAESIIRLLYENIHIFYDEKNGVTQWDALNRIINLDCAPAAGLFLL